MDRGQAAGLGGLPGVVNSSQADVDNPGAPPQAFNREAQQEGSFVSQDRGDGERFLSSDGRHFPFSFSEDAHQPEVTLIRRIHS